jgi:hypothetical protein
VVVAAEPGPGLPAEDVEQQPFLDGLRVQAVVLEPGEPAADRPPDHPGGAAEQQAGQGHDGDRSERRISPQRHEGHRGNTKTVFVVPVVPPRVSAFGTVGLLQ